MDVLPNSRPADLLLVVASRTCVSVAGVRCSRVVRSVVAHLENLSLVVFDVLLIATVVHELLHDFRAIGLVDDMAVRVETAVFAVLVLVVAHEIGSVAGASARNDI